MEVLLRAIAPNRMVSIFVTMLVALLSLVSPHSVANLADSAVPRDTSWAVPVDKTFNLHQMTPRLYRSALPNSSSLPLLQSLDIRTVVSFIKEEDAAWTGNSDLILERLPMHADRIDDTDVLRALRTLHTAQSRGPVLMHCKHGRNRTGLMAAMYRIVLQGWSKEAALEEMQSGGFGEQDKLKQATRYVRSVDVARLRQAYANGECSTRRLSSCRLRTWWAAW